jgi:hypothetical protein
MLGAKVNKGFGKTGMFSSFFSTFFQQFRTVVGDFKISPPPISHHRPFFAVITEFSSLCINIPKAACLMLPLSLRPYLFLKNQKRAITSAPDDTEEKVSLPTGYRNENVPPWRFSRTGRETYFSKKH